MAFPRKRLNNRMGYMFKQAVRARVADTAHFRALGSYSHSIVPGGFDVMSSVTRFTCAISLIIREATFSSRS